MHWRERCRQDKLISISSVQFLSNIQYYYIIHRWQRTRPDLQLTYKWNNYCYAIHNIIRLHCNMLLDQHRIICASMKPRLLTWCGTCGVPGGWPSSRTSRSGIRPSQCGFHRTACNHTAPPPGPSRAAPLDPCVRSAGWGERKYGAKQGSALTRPHHSPSVNDLYGRRYNDSTSCWHVKACVVDYFPYISACLVIFFFLTSY